MIHLVVTLGMTAVAIEVGYDRFETGEDPTTLNYVLSWIVAVLFQPMATLFNFIHHQTGRGIPDIIEWPLFFLNSVLWGATIGVFWSFVVRSNLSFKRDALKRAP
jgi:hypothetical protein